MFLVVAVAALGAVGATTSLMSTQVVQAAGHGGECHINGGSAACTGPGVPDFLRGVCNKDGCHATGPK